RVFRYSTCLWPGLFTSVRGVEFWRVVTDAYTITEAKRIFGPLGGGGTAGALLGPGAAVLLTRLGTPELLLAAGVLLATSVAFCPRPPAIETDADTKRAPKLALFGFTSLGSN